MTRHFDPAPVIRLFLACLVVLLATGCAGIAPRPAVPASHALADVGDTRLVRILASAAPTGERDLSGLRLLPDGETAFNARVALARRAEKSIDAQYYLIQNDDIGQQFLRELRDAAMRGVRVRLLVDDLYAGGEDELFAGLAAYPNVEVRVFNPLPVRAGRFTTRLLFSLHQFQRINHRMHNKMLIVNNSIAVLGGRNIANEYFMRSPVANFVDLDVLSSGPVVPRLSDVFDSYWNSERAYPIGALVNAAVAQRPAQAAQARFDELLRDASPSVGEPERDMLGKTPVAQQLDSGTLELEYGTARVFADTPDKAADMSDAALESTVSEQTLALFAQAQRRVAIVSPYFIPGERGLEIMRRGISAGGEVTVVTNSVGATDEPLVHTSYSRYRLDMLRAGVEIHEISPASLASPSARLGRFGRSIGRLHAKVAVIDRRLMFIGSMNLDARSARANTEVGLVIESPALVEQASTTLFHSLVDSASYKLRLTPDRADIEWIETRADGARIIHTREPDHAWLLRLKLWLLSPFVGEDLL
jgi:putative cardiolipin synthase